MIRLNKLLLILPALCTVAIACTSPEDRASNYLDKAQVLFDAGDYVNARLEAQNAAQIEPKNADVRYLLALIAEQDRDFRQTASNLMFTVNMNPEHVEARVKLGNLYYLARAFTLASQQAKAAKAIAPDNTDVRALNARILAEKRKFDDALAEIQFALSIEPDKLDAILIEIGLYMAKGERQRAFDMLDQAIARFDLKTGRPLREMRLMMLGEEQRLRELELEYLALVADFPPDFIAEDRLPTMRTALVYPFEPEVYAAHLERGREVLGADDPVIEVLLRGMEPEEAMRALLAETQITSLEFENELRKGGWEAIVASEDPAIVAARVL